MRIAIMQPYFFPYIGYFQLIRSVDTFVFYDDVNFIKRGWINRNKFLVNGEERIVTIPCVRVSQNKLIKDIQVDTNNPIFRNAFRTLELSYKRAPYFDDVWDRVVSPCLSMDQTSISDFCIVGVRNICDYLGIRTQFKISSVERYGNDALPREERLIDIVRREGFSEYVNAIGGQAIYDKSYFRIQGVVLHFLKPSQPEYSQFGDSFVANLSILDMMMFLEKERILDLLDSYELV